MKAQNVGERIVATIYDHPILSTLLFLLITALAGVSASRVGVDNAIDIWFLEDDPALVAYREFQETFGNDEVAVIAFHDEDGILDAEGIALLRDASQRAEAIDGIAAVESLLTVQDVRAGMFGVQVGPLLPEALPADALPAVRARILADPLLSGTLISEDGTTALLLARMEAMDDIDARRDDVLGALYASLAELDKPAWYAGVGVVYEALNRLSTEDALRFMVASYALIVILLAWLYRRIAAMAVTMLVVGAGALWQVGALGALGRDINMVTMVLPTLVLIIGISDVAHILNHAAQDTRPGESRRDRVVRTVGDLFWPCLYNTFTSTLGFLALLTAPMAVVRDLGLFAAVGLNAAFVAAILGCTVALRFEQSEPRSVEGGWLERLADGIATFGIRHHRGVLVASALLALLALPGIASLEVDTYSIEFMKPDHKARTDSENIEAHFGYYAPLEVLVTAEQGALEPEVLAAVDAWQARAVAEMDTLGWSRSLTGPLKRVRQTLVGGSPDEYKLPATSAGVEQVLAVYARHDAPGLRSLMSGEDTLRVTFGMKMQSARGMAATMEEVTQLAALPPGVTLQPSGYLPLYTRMMDYIVLSQVNSFGTAFAVVFVLFALLFRSARAAALAIPSNLIPVLLTLGLMGFFGVPLDVATVTVAAIVLGLVVDDTVQFIYRLRAELHEHGDHERAVRTTINTLGRSVLISSLGLSLGFSVLALANVGSVVWFGILTAGTMLMAQFMELLVMPALVVWWKPRL